YCHFYVVKDRLELQELLVESLQMEWEQKRPLLEGKTLISIYFGGGTPSLLPPAAIETLLRMIWTSGFSLDGVEITMEANPEGVDLSYFTEIRSLGVNRLSIGVQSLDDRSLLIIGRGHGTHVAKKAIFTAHQASFENISIDLMYDLPDQSEKSFSYTLDQIPDLPIHHLSLYNLTIEPNTAFYRKKSALTLPDSASSLRLLNLALQKLPQCGFTRYEISAFAKDEKKSIHNLGYWTGRPFLGLGPSAFSYWEGARMRNILDLVRYAALLKQGKSPIDFSEKLPSPKDAQELFAVRLRLFDGADLNHYPTLSQETVAVCRKWIHTGHLEQKGTHIRLTPQGTLFYDEIAADLI
ncbi:MAG TPA: coproporphyrinogen-III oxidase family protein, partial [Chlamydiales bacterium]|nr:coproporphyrinogen-III oxidase family protein [Chlamydiales bacterium]